jgi:hypothetical protein
MSAELIVVRERRLDATNLAGLQCPSQPSRLQVSPSLAGIERHWQRRGTQAATAVMIDRFQPSVFDNHDFRFTPLLFVPLEPVCYPHFPTDASDC